MQSASSTTCHSGRRMCTGLKPKTGLLLCCEARDRTCPLRSNVACNAVTRHNVDMHLGHWRMRSPSICISLCMTLEVSKAALTRAVDSSMNPCTAMWVFLRNQAVVLIHCLLGHLGKLIVHCYFSFRLTHNCES